MTSDPAGALVEAVRVGLREHADPQYVAGTVAARSPGKPVLGVRIPLLRGAVRAALRQAAPRRKVPDPALVRAAADRLWHADAHEDELAGCMLLRLAGVPPTVEVLQGWALLLDNWLSVDELGGVVGAAVHDGHLSVHDLRFLATAVSPWQRRLYLVALITPVRHGLDPVGVPLLGEVLPDAAVPVRKAAVWLIKEAVKARPDVAGRFRIVLGEPAPTPLLRLLEPAVG